MYCQSYYKTQDGEEIQCNSKKGWLRNIAGKTIFLCPEHCLLFINQMHPIAKLKLNAENMTPLCIAILGDSNIKVSNKGRYELLTVIRTLDKREQMVLTYRFGLNGELHKTLAEVGQIMGTNRERVRQIEAKALRKLRHPSRSRRIKEILI